ncbi:MAG: pyridine nucleotide-disulfide oxidoreductase [Hyphomicrobiaceae bacterium]
MLFGFAIVATLVAGWVLRGEEHITASEGLGYWLGIAGASAMLLLLIYPMRKRISALRHIGTVRFWFSLHMLLGIIGPVLILFHCNFSLGSLNSNVALFTMLTVAVSGLAGRYLHGKIHRRFDGQKLTAAALLEDLDRASAALDVSWATKEFATRDLKLLATTIAEPPRGVFDGVWRQMRLSWIRPRAMADFLKAARISLRQARQSNSISRREEKTQLRVMRKLMRAYLDALDRAARFAVYDRLFSLWHVLHMPLFVMLVFSVIVHVIGVHLY